VINSQTRQVVVNLSPTATPITGLSWSYKPKGAASAIADLAGNLYSSNGWLVAEVITEPSPFA
jgi:hypothetical protein